MWVAGGEGLPATHMVDDVTYFTQGISAKSAATATAAAESASRRDRMTGPSFLCCVCQDGPGPD
jgi:hypothetical protein